jgi:transglutaminase-like putative cysteine protease
MIRRWGWGLVGLLGWGLSSQPLPALAQTAAPRQAAPLPLRFGQPEPADFEPERFAADSGAVAVVLCDFGQARFASTAGHMAVVSERTKRLKILKKAGYAHATVEIPLYHEGENAERLSNLRGFTYVRGADGTITKTKLEASGAFEEKRTNKLKVYKFTLPNVQEGAVIEYAYTVTSTFFNNFQDWTFQAEIPTRWSEYRTSIPQVYHYKALYQGYLPFAVNELGVGSVNMVLDTHPGDGRSTSSQTLSLSTEQHRWVIRNAPAFREEPYLTTAADYLARMTFELAGIQMPNEPYRDLTDSWTKKNKVLLEDEFFGLALTHDGFLADAVRPLVAQYPSPAARAAAVRELVLRSVKYDGTNRYHATAPLKKSYELHRGSAADVNLLLIAALRQAGLPAQPVLLSTRAHGRVSQEYPLLEQFNYVVALLETPGQPDLLLDATEPLLPAGTLPPRCLNRLGHTIAEGGEGRWVSLLPGPRYTHFQDIKLTLDTQGNLTGQVHEEHGGYAALEVREQVQQLGEKKYLTQLATTHAGWEVAGPALSGQATAGQPLALRYEVRQPAAAPGVAQELYIKLLESFGERQNPFRHAQRSYPVDMGMLQQEIILLTLTLPPGYTAELPKPANLLLPDNGGRYMYMASAPAPNTVQLTSRLTLDKPVYSPEEYHALRELYRQMLVRQAEALVIKKG